MKKFGLFVPVRDIHAVEPITIRISEADMERVTRMHLLSVEDRHEPCLFFVDSTDALVESLSDGTAQLTFTRMKVRQVSQRPSNDLVSRALGSRSSTNFLEGTYTLSELAEKSFFDETTSFDMERIEWQDTTNPDVLRYVFGSFPTALIEAELERRRVENEQEEQQDQHDDETWQQEQAEYDEHQRRELDRNRGLNQ